MPGSDNRFDRQYAVEETEDLSKSERDASRGQIRHIIEHLLQLEYSPSPAPRYDCMHSIADARAMLDDKLSPTLRGDIEATMGKLYDVGRRNAALALRLFGEENVVAGLPAAWPYSLDAICRVT